MKNDARVLFLTKYGRSGASSRYRVLQYIPYLESRGIRCTVQSLHTDDYLEAMYSGRGKSPWYHVARLLARSRAVARGARYSAVFVQKELAPRFPPLFELLLSALHAKVIYDIDDAIFLLYAESKNPFVRLILGRKIPSALRRSEVVLAGNSFLMDYAARFNRRTILFPTVVDTAKYQDARSFSRGREEAGGGSIPIIGWIGSPETARYLAEKADVLRMVAKKVPFELRAIGASGLDIPGIDLKCLPWSEESEAHELSQCDVGIMPLPSSDWSKGKCGLKLLQYLASGLPVVSSPGGGADLIVQHGVNGYVARSDDEWRLHCAALLDNPELRRLMGREGRRRVEERFSLEVWAPRLAEIITRIVRGESLEGIEW